MSNATPTVPFYPVTHDDGLDIVEKLEGIRQALAPTKSGTIYGFHIDSSESDPAAAVTYVGDAVGMTPAAMNFSSGVFSYGSWGNAFFMPRPCMLKYDGTVDYYLDPNDYTKKYGSSTASDVATDSYAGNAMMEWGQNGKKIWYKIVPDADPTSCTVYIADYQADGDFKAWSFINSAGEYTDHFYTPIYNGWLDSSNRMRSISGKTPTASLTAANERTYCRKNNESLAIWDTEVFADVILINFLLVLMGKSLNTQAVFGEGCTTPGQGGVLATGTGNALGMFFGYSGTTSVVKVFGMENWWGNLWRRFGGLINDNGTMKYKLTRGTQDGSSESDYVVSTTSGDYSGYLQGGSMPTSGSGSYIKRMIYNKYAYTPSELSGYATTFYGDGCWFSNGQVDYAFRGGRAVDGSPCGAFCLFLGLAASYAAWDLAAAPSCKPL